MRSVDLIDCQVGRNRISSCQVGNGKRSGEGLEYYQRSSVKVQIAKWEMRWGQLIS
jgi:hypothetical protein